MVTAMQYYVACIMSSGIYRWLYSGQIISFCMLIMVNIYPDAYIFWCFAHCQLKTERTEALAKAAEEAANAARKPVRKRAEDESKPKVFKSGIGKYINPHLQ